MEPLPREIFKRELGQITVRELLKKDENGEYINLDTTDDRETCTKRYRIPTHQRHDKWTPEAKETIIDSMAKGYIVGSLSFSRHTNNDGTCYINIEDGQSRLTVIQEYIEDKFKYKKGLFSERTRIEQDRFLDYVFSTETTTPSMLRPSAERDATTTQDHYFENFDRINRGEPLKDNDKYWCMKHKPMVDLAIRLMERWKVDYPFMKTEKFNTKDAKGKHIRKPLEEVVTMVDAILNGIYKKTYMRHYEKIGLPITQGDERKVDDFMTFYGEIYDTMLQQMPKRDREQFNFNNPGRFLGPIIMHFNHTNDGMSNDEKKDMWVNILNIDRSSDNFMKGTATLWNGFTAANQKNQEQENIRMRLDRVKEFYQNKGEVSNQHRIEYIEP